MLHELFKTLEIFLKFYNVMPDQITAQVHLYWEELLKAVVGRESWAKREVKNKKLARATFSVEFYLNFIPLNGVSHLVLVFHIRFYFYIFIFQAWNVAKFRVKGVSILSQPTVSHIDLEKGFSFHDFSLKQRLHWKIKWTLHLEHY